MSGIDEDAKTTRVRPQYLPEELPAAETTRPIRSRRAGSQGSGTGYRLMDLLHLAEAVPVVRQRLDVPVEFTDDSILASLKAIAVRTSDRDRWQAAFESNLARYLSVRGRDLGKALQDLIALVPPPRQ